MEAAKSLVCLQQLGEDKVNYIFSSVTLLHLHNCDIIKILGYFVTVGNEFYAIPLWLTKKKKQFLIHNLYCSARMSMLLLPLRSGYPNKTNTLWHCRQTLTGMSPLLIGHQEIHRHLDQQVAKFLGVEDAITFPMGFATNSMNIPCIAHKVSCWFGLKFCISLHS